MLVTRETMRIEGMTKNRHTAAIIAGSWPSMAMYQTVVVKPKKKAMPASSP